MSARKRVVVATPDTTPIHIDVSQIPKIEMDVLCATILEAAQKFYEDPENRRRFEEWQKSNNGG